MMFILRRIVRFILMLAYASKAYIQGGSKLSPFALANRWTVLHGKNRIHAKVNVANTEVGYATYIGRSSVLPDAIIGAYCSIAENVQLLAYTHPAANFVSTHPAFFSLAGQSGVRFVREQKFDEKLVLGNHPGKSLQVGNDVWIGQNVLIIGGLTIGDGAIIGAGSVVTRDVPAYAIVAGVPAKLIRYRFSLDQIEALQQFRWWARPASWIRLNVAEFESIERFSELMRVDDQTRAMS